MVSPIKRSHGLRYSGFSAPLCVKLAAVRQRVVAEDKIKGRKFETSKIQTFKNFENVSVKSETFERTTISQRKSKTTEAVANRGVDADAPRGENEDQKKEENSNRGNPFAEIHTRKSEESRQT